VLLEVDDRHNQRTHGRRGQVDGPLAGGLEQRRVPAVRVGRGRVEDDADLVVLKDRLDTGDRGRHPEPGGPRDPLRGGIDAREHRNLQRRPAQQLHQEVGPDVAGADDADLDGPHAVSSTATEPTAGPKSAS
jgi:hypothetical protein